MKRILTFLIVFAIVSCIGFSAYAEESTGTTSEPEYVKDILIDSPYSKIAELIMEPSLYDDSAKDFSLDGKPRLLVKFTAANYKFYGETLFQHFSQFSDCGSACYVLTEPVVVLRHIYADGMVYVNYVQNNTSLIRDPQYVQDVCTGGINQVICGESCTVQDVVVFDGTTDYVAESGYYAGSGAAAFYVTDKGVFVRYYETIVSEAVDFTFADYKAKTDAYCEFLKTQSHHPTVSFLQYCENPGAYPLEQEPTEPVPTTPTTHPTEFILPIAACVAVITVAIVAIVIIIRKNKKHSTEPPASPE